MANADNSDFGFCGFGLLVGSLTELMLEEFLDSLCLGLDGASRCLLNEDVTILRDLC